jgi:hypothetical protein
MATSLLDDSLPDPPPRLPSFRQGDRCLVSGVHAGLIQLVHGEVGAAEGMLVGVLLDEAVGESNGAHGGRRYFYAPPHHATFVAPSLVQLAPTQPTGRPSPSPPPPAAGGAPSSPGRKAKLRTTRAKPKTARGSKTRRAVSSRAPDAGSSTNPRAAVASQCVADGRGLHIAVVKQTAQFVISARDGLGRRLPAGGERFEVLVRSLLPPANIFCKLLDHGDGTYTGEYKPSVTGQILVSISLEGEPIVGAPFTVTAVTLRPEPSRCVVRGEALTTAVARKPMAFEVEFVDKFGMVAYSEDLDVRAAPIPSSPSVVGASAGEGVAGAEERRGGIGLLTVTLLRASGLAAVDLDMQSDPYAMLRSGEHQGTSSIRPKTTEPRWDEAFAWRGSLGAFVTDGLLVTLYDSDSAQPRPAKDDLLGHASVSLAPLLEESQKGPVEMAISLSTEGVTAVGFERDLPHACPRVTDDLPRSSRHCQVVSEAGRGISTAKGGKVCLRLEWSADAVEVAPEPPYGLVVGQERHVLGGRPLIVREGAELDSAKRRVSVRPPPLSQDIHCIAAPTLSVCPPARRYRGARECSSKTCARRRAGTCASR